MTRSLLVHDTPSQLQGVGTESDQELRIPVGSTSMAAFRASNERPSELRDEVRGMERQRKRKRRVMMLEMRTLLL